MARTGILVECILLACCFNEFISFCKLCFSCVYFVVCIFFFETFNSIACWKERVV